MPIKLRVSERTEVDPAFVDAIKELWKMRWYGLNQEVKNADPRYKKMVLDKNARVMGLLKAYCTQDKAFDGQKTQLMCLPYMRFYTQEHNGEDYFVGLTKPILLSDARAKRWQGPRYFVYIPMDYTERGTDGKFHFVPEGDEMTYSRHPHHKAKQRYNWGDENEIDYSNAKIPLDLIPDTCWGEFPTIVKGCVHSGDTINLFRTLHLYLSRINENSLLCHSWQTRVWKRLEDVATAPEPKRRARR